MCRWLAYSGTPILLEELIYKPAHSLIDQSLHSRLGAETTNGDGFGIGWYAEGEIPSFYRSAEPAWNDRNLREVARNIRAGLIFAHIRASTGTPVQQTNCHPFRHGRWLWMHNGSIARFPELKRELALEVDPVLHQLSDETRLVVSEPLADLAGAWNEVPESSCGVIHHGHDELKRFTPRP